MKKFIPYGRQSISEEDVQAVVDVLRSDWLTQGPDVEKFERAVAEYCGAKYAVAVANGTAALHLAVLAAGFGIDDEVITSPITFVASANCIVYAGATPVFADIDTRTYCIDPVQIRSKVTSKSKGLIPVHFTGQPCDMGEIANIAQDNNLVVIEDAAHAIGASYEVNGQSYKVGSCAHSDMTIFSFHPVKHMTTGEGGMITTNNPELYEKLCLLRTHGITKDPGKLTRNDGPWYYEQQELGFNYRITDMQCALGLSQLKRLDDFITRRRQIVAAYNKSFPIVKSCYPRATPRAQSAWHLYTPGFHSLKGSFSSNSVNGLGVTSTIFRFICSHIISGNYGYQGGDYPKAERYYQDRSHYRFSRR